MAVSRASRRNRIPSSDADLSAVIEAGDFSADEWARFTAATPGHEWRRFDGSTMLGVRGRILSHEPLGVHDLYRCHRVRVALPDRGDLTVVVPDVRSQPWLSRERALAGILAAAGEDPRAIILGDFNTPPESRWFRGWRERGFTLANDGPRRGLPRNLGPRPAAAHARPRLARARLEKPPRGEIPPRLRSCAGALHGRSLSGGNARRTMDGLSRPVSSSVLTCF